MKWLDRWKLAFSGVVLVFSYRKFRITAIIVFILFGTLMNLLTGGFAAFNLLFAVSFPDKLKIIFDAFLGLFGIGKNFLDWALIFFIALIQAVLVGLVAFIWKRRKDNLKAAKASNSGAQSAGIAAGLAVLGAGCPTCGTTLIAPIISTIFSSGGYAIAGFVSGFITFIAIIVSLLALKKVGLEAYVIIKKEKFLAKKGVENARRKQ
ncbi:hypothetical protein IJI94_00335 [Candidatus Saccharibacteria bacterium]|nr:hypothetical protein [Candidatus Saccharibacteria bacterium]